MVLAYVATGGHVPFCTVGRLEYRDDVLSFDAPNMRSDVSKRLFTIWCRR